MLGVIRSCTTNNRDSKQCSSSLVLALDHLRACGRTYIPPHKFALDLQAKSAILLETRRRLAAEGIDFTETV